MVILIVVRNFTAYSGPSMAERQFHGAGAIAPTLIEDTWLYSHAEWVVRQLIHIASGKDIRLGIFDFVSI